MFSLVIDSCHGTVNNILLLVFIVILVTLYFQKFIEKLKASFVATVTTPNFYLVLHQLLIYYAV